MTGQIEPSCRPCDGYMHGGCVDPASTREFLSADDRPCRLYRVRAMRPDASTEPSKRWPYQQPAAGRGQ